MSGRTEWQVHRKLVNGGGVKNAAENLNALTTDVSDDFHGA